MRYIKLFEEYTYSEVVELIKSEAPIKTYLINVYPNEKQLTGRHGHGFSMNQLKNVLRFAKKEKNQTLIKLVEDHLKFIDEMPLRREAEKYNL